MPNVLRPHTLVIIAAGIAAIFLLLKTGIVSSLMLFILFGAIPGTDAFVSPTLMLLVYSAVFLAVVVRLVALSPRENLRKPPTNQWFERYLIRRYSARQKTRSVTR